MDGFDLCHNLKDSQAKVKSFVIMISAKCREQDKLYAHILGADAYFTKPFSVEALMKMIREVEEMQNIDFVVTHK